LLSSGWDFRDNLIIGHSSGAVAILGLLEALADETEINTAVLVGVFRGDLGWDSLKDLNINFDYSKIKTKAKQFIIIHSDNDPHCPPEGAKWVAKQLGVDIKVFPGMKHFSYSKDSAHEAGGPSFKQFPELLQIIKQKML